MDQRRWVVGTIAVLCTLGLCCGLACVGGFVLLGGRYRPCVPGRPAGISTQDLAGRYRTAGGGELVLQVSGTLMSRGITIDFQGAPVTLSGRGTWSLLPRDDGFGDISLGFDEAQFATYLRVTGTREAPWLYWYIGDPDSCVIRRFDRV